MIETEVFLVAVLTWAGLVTYLLMDICVFYRRHLAPISKN